MSRTSRRRKRVAEHKSAIVRNKDYRHLKNTLTRQPAFSQDHIEDIHHTALKVLENLGIRMLNAEARDLFKQAGIDVDEKTQMVRIPAAVVDASLSTAPEIFHMHGAKEKHRVIMGKDNVAFVCVGGAPHVSDIDQGKRVATLADTRNFIRLCEYFDVFHLLSPNVESQDIAVNLRHLHVTESQLTLSGKPHFIYSRGTGQVHDAFEMTRIARALTESEFGDSVWCYTIINTNSPRQLDVPMCQGIIDFARAGQLSVITPFTLAGAMAPITMTGALVLQHAEALAGITLAQLVRPGVPVMYGSFTSNVDMRSGSPAFGTPEFVRAAFGAGQLARHIGIPWRGSAATAANSPDEQSVYEFMMSAWGSVLGGVNMLVHAAGWLEGGLTGSFEKFILDAEVLQTFAEIFEPLRADEAELSYATIASVEPGGHFFGCEQTLSRYHNEFYEPLVSDWSNYGQWMESGGLSATQRANGIWKKILDEFEPPQMPEDRVQALNDFIERRAREGGSPV